MAMQKKNNKADKMYKLPMLKPQTPMSMARSFFHCALSSLLHFDGSAMETCLGKQCSNQPHLHSAVQPCLRTIQPISPVLVLTHTPASSSTSPGMASPTSWVPVESDLSASPKGLAIIFASKAMSAAAGVQAWTSCGKAAATAACRGRPALAMEKLVPAPPTTTSAATCGVDSGNFVSEGACEAFCVCNFSGLNARWCLLAARGTRPKEGLRPDPDWAFSVMAASMTVCFC
mmetsp:Transcript_67821/g.196160  ORF Transcript_67821/g.196160 Transcript_67821/m.196160 type:complete len:231 (+) Transcript_67821:384-1076(+)